MPPDPAREEVIARIERTRIEGTPREMRAAFRRLFEPATRLDRTIVAGVSCGVAGPEAGSTILWLHGGGLVLGSPDTHGAAAGYLAEATGRRVLVPDYPLAPEHPWPAPRDACLAVLDALSGPVHVVGDSVGGQLALILAFRRPGRIAGLSLVSPNTDRTGRSETRGRDTDLMNDDSGDLGFARMAFGEIDPSDPEVSPLLADLSGLPPTLVLTAGDEILQDDGLLLVRAAARAGVDVAGRNWPGLWHLWPLWPRELPEARAALDVVAAHVGRTLD